MTNATTNVARVAAAVAGLGLVAMSFAPLAGAQTMTTTNTSTTSTSTNTMAMFTRDLTVGSTGSDVMSLQTWLMGKGFSIPAGATGYFGAQTKAALAAYQAANMISPAAGYFGPITRAKVMAGGSTTTTSTVAGCMPGAMYSSTTGAACTGSTTTTTGGSTTLSGGEADLKNFDLRTGDDLGEGDTNVEIADAKFDVDGGDVNVGRVTLTLQATSKTAGSVNPWKYFDGFSVYAGSKKIGTVDAGNRSAYDDSDTDTDLNNSGADSYSIDIETNGVVKEGDAAELSIRADAQSNIDSDDEDQTFTLAIKDEDIRATDSKGIQQYTGDDNDSVTVGFDSSNSGDLSVRESSDDPDAGVLVADDEDSTNDLSVFKFEFKNNDSDDALLDDLNIQVATSTGQTTPLTTLIRRATVTIGGKDYDADIHNTTGSANGYLSVDLGNDDVVLSGDDTTDGELTISLASQSGHYSATGNSLTFSIRGAQDVTAEGDESGDDIDVTGTANGNKQSVAVNGGINVEGNNDTTALTYNSQTPSSSYGTFTLKQDVTAVGDDVYVPKTVQAIASSTTPGANTGFVVITDLLASTTSGVVTASLTSTADSDNSSYYVVHEGDTETFTITVTINPSMDGDFQVGLDRVRFSSTDADFSNIQTLDVDQTDDQYKTDPLHIPNS